MRQIVLLILRILLLSSCKKKCSDCGPHQDCVNGICQCQQWYEGANCETPMIDKFVGTYIGTRYTNGSNPLVDTFIVEKQGPPNATSVTHTSSNDEGSISLQSSITGDYFTYIYLPNQLGDIRKKCGKVTTTVSGADLALTYYWINGNGDVDSNTLFTFIGTKQ